MLHLVAADEADLSIISVQMQDAVLRREDMSFDAKRRRYSLVANRFAWDALPAKTRRRAGLRFDDVEAVQAQGLEAIGAQTVLSLLAISIEKQGELAGIITFVFSGNVSVRLKISCINAALDDIGGAWGAAHTPMHQG